MRPRLRTHRAALPFLLSLAITGLAAGDEAPPRPSVDDQDAVTIRGLFDFQLPKILQPEALRFTVTPQWSGFLHDDVVKVRFGARYSFNRHIEGSAELLSYFDTFGDEGRGGIGLAEYRFGAKYSRGTFPFTDIDMAFGANVSIPVPGAHHTTTIGTARYSPFVVFTRDWPRVQGLSTFLNLGAEIFDSTPDPERIARCRPGDDNLTFTPGVVLHRAPWHYTLALSYRTTSITDDNRDFYSVLPSVSWEIPERYTSLFRGRWVAGLGYEAIFFDEGVEHRVTGRLKWDFDWRRAVRTVGHGVKAVGDGMRAVGDTVRDNLPWNGGKPASSPAGNGR